VKPVVSVCIPTHDRVDWLAEALDSVLAQSLREFEIVVGDDASSDGTADLLAARSETRLRWLRHREPLGVAKNRNALLAAARGRYVAWLDSDDRLLPEMLERQCARLEREPRTAFVHGGFDTIGADGRTLPEWPQPFDADVVEPGHEAFAELSTGNYVTAPTVVVRRSAHEAVGGYRDSLASGEDWEMWMRLALHGDVAYTSAKVAQYRWHPGSLARTAEADGRRFDRELAALRGVFAGPASSLADAEACETRARTALAARAIVAAGECLTRGARREAMRRLLAAGRALPSLRRGPRLLRLFAAAARSDDYLWHVLSRDQLATLARTLGDCRAGRRLRRAITTSPAWRRTLRRIAATLRQVTPRGAAIAVIDKWDPTLLHLARRRGWHFPDRRLLPDGYPVDSRAAIRHLASFERRGADFLVVPCSAFWWLDAYPGLVAHLERRAEQAWSDDLCRIYRLGTEVRPQAA
jgi:GT2 family glycosyltransferase